jgi:hypothetical protein
MKDIEWKDVVGYERSYEVSNDGHVRNKKSMRILKESVKNSGYSFVCLSKGGETKTYSVHRIVMLAFNPIDNEELYEVHHKNWDKRDNRLENLEWTTHSDNVLKGSGPTELKVLEAMLCNAIKKSLHDWYYKLLTIHETKETFTEKVVEEAMKNATLLLEKKSN